MERIVLKRQEIDARNHRALLGTAVAAIVLAGCQTTEAARLIPAVGVASAPTLATVTPVPPAPRLVPPPAGLQNSVQLLVRQFQGKVGAAVASVDQGWLLSANGDVRLPQQSVSKLWVAMTVLDGIDAGRFTLDTPMKVTREDLTLFHQPIAAMVKPGQGFDTTVGDLLQRALTQSDNTANDRLLRFVGGPEAVRGFIARKALGNIRFGPGERLLQAQTAGLQWRPDFAFNNGFIRARAALPLEARSAALDAYVADPPDGAAPAAIATALSRLKQGELLRPFTTGYLIATMESSKTGRMRLRGAVPLGWSFGHKTGTGQDLLSRTAGYNDVGILTAPDGRSYTLAVMIGDTRRPIAERQALMQQVVASIIAYHGPGNMAAVSSPGSSATP